MSESKHKQFIAELLADGKRALSELRRDKKEQATLDKFSEKNAKSVRRSLTEVQKAANPYAERRALERAEIAAGKKPKRFQIKTTKIAAFLWLPQFHMCFWGGRHIYPVFMRIVAHLLVQAALLPVNHPSLRYGDEGVPRVGFAKMMGDVWYRLRTARTTNWYQYSLFSIAVMMVVTLTAAVGAFFTRIFLGIGEVAHAQLFFTHPGNPYGTGVTDITAPGAIAGASGLFDSRVRNNGISTDWGLMVLDKILRQAASDTPTGGALQNALAGMMGAYNTGITIVGGVILLWMITSVIIDTAKTGVFGGGRHNMAWAPIRIIFALGMLMPLGSGFSAGQYAVMKLAEWGSNFGTRAWSAYVGAVLADQSLLAPFDAHSATALTSAISKVLVCQVAYNTYLVQAQGGAPDPDQVIVRSQDTSAFTSKITNRYTNNTGSNICGTITYTATNNVNDDLDRIMSWVTGVSPLSASTPVVSPDFSPTPDQFGMAARNFRNAMRGAMEVSMADTVAGNLGSGGAVIEQARRFACRFVSHKFSDGGSGTSPVASTPHCDAGLTAAAAAYPTFDEQQAMINQMQADMTNQFVTQGRPALMAYIGAPMQAAMTARGWAGMGMWFQEIAGMNALISGAKEPAVAVEPGTVWMGASSNSFATLRCLASKVIGRSCRISGLEEKVVETLDGYDKWWDNSVAPGTPGVSNNTTVNSNRDVDTGTASNVKSLLTVLKNMSGGDNGPVMVIARFFVPNSTNVFLFKAVDIASTGTYPLAQLADTGHSVLGFGILLWGAVSLVQAVSTLEGFTFSLGLGVAVSAILNAFASIGSMMILAGLMISFYLPVLPFVRVAFAVLTWMVAVFEAVVMVPIAALAHLVSTGDGLTGGQPHLRNAYIMWLNVLMRPVLTVMGFVGGMLIYNTFAVYFHTTFSQGVAAMMSMQNYFIAVLAKCAYSVIYLGILYSAANTSFKLMEIFPENMVRWLGGTPDRSFRQEDDSAVWAYKGAQMAQGMQPSGNVRKANSWDQREQVDARAANIRESSTKSMSDRERSQAGEDKKTAYKRMSASDKARYARLDDDKKDDFLAKKFVEQENNRYIRLPFEPNLGGNRSFGMWGGKL